MIDCDAGTIGNDQTRQCETCSSDYASKDHTLCVVATNCGFGYYGEEASKQCTNCISGWTNLARKVCYAQKSDCDAGTIGNDQTHQCETCN